MLFKSILIAGFLCIFIIGVCANALVILLSFKPSGNVNVNVNVNTINTYLVNMAGADLLYIFGCLFYTLTNYNQDGWLFGDVGCRLILSIDVLTMHVSVYILTVMSIERYVAVVHPMLSLKYRSVGFARVIVAVIWVSALILATPMVASMALTRIHDGHGSVKYTCAWTLNGDDSLSTYMISVFLITFAIPSIIMVIAYLLLMAHFCQVRSERTGSQQVRRSKRRVAQIVFLVVLVFWICYTPFWVYQLTVLHVENFDPKQIMGLVTLIISYLNSCFNPFLYTLLPKRYNVWQKMRKQSSFSAPKYRLTGRPEVCDSL
ncbi:urotensin-2 receptor-like [Lytechinus variegatus]|uniref:urotensin-2 receptor-like n=1 Tax=Lytechinus variegatus TaxID=7654 RepID=UPI001BB0E116|nr:urotensin-2 receptor-like [Lytechinus variegatus]